MVKLYFREAVKLFILSVAVIFYPFKWANFLIFFKTKKTFNLQEKLALIRQLFQQQAAVTASSSGGGGTDTIKSGTSFKMNTANHTHSQIPQPQKLSLNKTVHLDIKKLC